MTDIRRNSPACPSCPAQAGDLACYTATGFPRHWHARRRTLALGGTLPAAKPAKSRAGARPSHKQADILASAISNDGVYEVSGYRFRGDAQRRSAMAAMSDDTRGWFTHAGETPHGTLYKITQTGRDAWARYEAWMRGET